MNVPDLSRTLILVRPLTPSNVFKLLRKHRKHTLISFLFYLHPRHHHRPADIPSSPARSMGLLDQLWDDTVAGPRPDIGLGKLRKTQTFSFRSPSGKGLDAGKARSLDEGSTEEVTRVTRSIMIVKPPGYGSGGNDSTPASPAGSTPPVSPFSGGRESFRFRRRSTSDAYEKANGVIGAKSAPSSYDV